MKLLCCSLCFWYFLGSFSGLVCGIHLTFSFLIDFACIRFIVSVLRMMSSSRDVGAVEDRELLSAVPLWEYCDHDRLFSGCYDARKFLKMALYGNRLLIYAIQERLRDTCVAVYAGRLGS